MTITFPRAMPAIGWRSSRVRPGWNVASATLYNGKPQSMELARAMWQGAWETQLLTRDRLRGLNAWFDSQRGGMRTFLAFDAARMWPVAYQGGFSGLVRAGGSTPFDGSAVVTAMTETTLTIDTLPDAFTLGEGDLLGLVQGGKYDLHSVSEAAVASSGGAVTLTVEPRVLTSIFTVGAGVQFASPVCEMMLDFSTVPDLTGQKAASTVKFSGMQRLYG